jgi:hypothetical protein
LAGRSAAPGCQLHPIRSRDAKHAKGIPDDNATGGHERQACPGKGRVGENNPMPVIVAMKPRREVVIALSLDPIFKREQRSLYASAMWLDR